MQNIATIFWDVKGILLCDVLPQGKDINAELYCTQLDKLVDGQTRRRDSTKEAPAARKQF